MLVGTYEHNIDGKNRVFVPSKFRDEMGDEFIYKLCPSKYPSIQLYKKDDYMALFPKTEVDTNNQIQDRRERARRNMGSGESSCDTQGRIIINPLIAKLAKLSKQCVFVGFETYVEIMSPETYENYLMSLYEEYMAEEDSFEAEEAAVRKLSSEGAFISKNEKESEEA